MNDSYFPTIKPVKKDKIVQLHKIKESVLLKNHNEVFFEISFNKPKTLNSFDYEMTVRILNHQNTIDNYPAPNNIKKLVLYTSNVPKTFCTGGNLSALYFQKLKNEEEKIFIFYDNIIKQNIYSLTTDNLVFAIWDGYVMGGGVGISINCPIRICTENCIFSMPETSIGLYPDVGTGYFFPRIFKNNSAIGLYCGLVGVKITGELCVKCGLATHFIKSNQIQELINHIKSNSINIFDYASLDSLISNFCISKYSESSFYFPNEDLINKIFECDSLENIFNRIEKEYSYLLENSKNEINKLSKEKEENELVWLNNIRKTLNQCSPLSLFIYFEYFNIGKRRVNHPLEVFKLDRILFHKMVYDSDFFEGIRSVLVNKDKKPYWKFKSLKEINKENTYHQYFISEEIIGKPKF